MDLSADVHTEHTAAEGFKARALAWLAADRQRRYWVLVLFVAALLVRLHWNLRVHPLQSFVFSDMKGYWGRADAVLDHPFSVGEYQAFFPFGTTWLLAGIKAVFGRDAFGAVSVVYAIMGASVVAASFAIADRIACSMGVCARWVAPAVGLFLTVYYPLLAIGGYILSELPFCFCLTISLLLLVRIVDGDGGPRDAWLLGTTLGIGALFRPQILLSIAVVGVLWLLMVIGSRRGKPNPYARLSWAMLGRVAVPLVLLLTMASIRYYAHTKELGLVSGNSSINLVFGRCHNKGIYSRPDGEGHSTVRFSPPPLIQLEIFSAEHPDALFRTRSVWGDHPEPVEDVPGFAVDSYGCKRRKCHQPGSEIEYRGYIGDKDIHKKIVRACIERGGLARQAYFTATHWVMLWRLNVMWPDQANPRPRSEEPRETWRWRQQVWAQIHRGVLMVPALLGLVFVLVPRRRPKEALVSANLWALLVVAGIWFGDMRMRASYDPIITLLAAFSYAIAWERGRAWLAKRRESKREA